ncbi:hypothetical protein V1511DRAFT_509873 [Dipodascopsis uninucleata]
MMSAREERKMKDTLARIERLEQEEKGHVQSSPSTNSVRKRKRSSAQSSSPLRSQGSSPNRNEVYSSERGKRALSADSRSRRGSLDSDYGEWLPPKLLIVRRFYEENKSSLPTIIKTIFQNGQTGSQAAEIGSESILVSQPPSSNLQSEDNGDVSSKTVSSITPSSPVVSPQLNTNTISKNSQFKKSSSPKSFLESPNDILENAPLLSKPKSGPELSDLFSDSIDDDLKIDKAGKLSVKEEAKVIKKEADSVKSVLYYTNSTSSTQSSPPLSAGHSTASASVPSIATMTTIATNTSSNTARSFSQQQVSQTAVCGPTLVTFMPGSHDHDGIQNSAKLTELSVPPVITRPAQNIGPISSTFTPHAELQQSATGNSSTNGTNNPTQSPIALQSATAAISGVVNTPPPRPVKKLSFADYRKKQNPGPTKEKEK